MQYKFIKYTKLWFTLSLIVILIGVGAMVNNKIQIGSSLVYGIDFTGGSLMEFEFAEGLDPSTLTRLTQRVSVRLPSPAKTPTSSNPKT